MEFLRTGIGRRVLDELAAASEARIAVAFFNPDVKTHRALKKLKKGLSLVISDEFIINNPYRLEQLRGAEVRSIPSKSDGGRLHAKVFIIRRKSGTTWVLLGSANLTRKGLFENQEACVSLDSSLRSDCAQIERIEAWFGSLTGFPIDFARAKSIYKKGKRARSQLISPGSASDQTKFWALKTTSNSASRDHWPSDFRNAIAVGWPELPGDPSKLSRLELRNSIRKTYKSTKRSAEVAAATIWKFAKDLSKGDKVLICRGYVATQKKRVRVYAVATVAGSFRAEIQKGENWRFKRRAIIQPFANDFSVPVQTFVSALKKKSMRQTIHSLDELGFRKFMEEIQTGPVKSRS